MSKEDVKMTKNEELKEICKPLIKWLNSGDFHPHIFIEVRPTGATIWEGSVNIVDYSYLKD
jgi:hypothetical protein